MSKVVKRGSSRSSSTTVKAPPLMMESIPQQEFEQVYEEFLRISKLHSIDLRNGGSDSSRVQLMGYVARELAKRIGSPDEDFKNLSSAYEKLKKDYSVIQEQFEEGMKRIKFLESRQLDPEALICEPLEEVPEDNPPEASYASTLMEQVGAKMDNLLPEDSKLRKELNKEISRRVALVERLDKTEKCLESSFDMKRPTPDLTCPDYPETANSRISHLQGQIHAYERMLSDIMRKSQ